MTKIDIEPWVEEVCALMEAKGYWPFVQRDRSLWGSVYITACRPPLSMGRKALPTPIQIRVADHPPGKNASTSYSVHPGGMTPAQAFRAAREHALAEREAHLARILRYRN